jgi:hypothetical protein
MAQSNTYSNAMPVHKESEARGEIEQLAAQQGVMPVTDLDELRGDFGWKTKPLTTLLTPRAKRRRRTYAGAQVVVAVVVDTDVVFFCSKAIRAPSFIARIFPGIC